MNTEQKIPGYPANRVNPITPEEAIPQAELAQGDPGDEQKETPEEPKADVAPSPSLSSVQGSNFKS